MSMARNCLTPGRLVISGHPCFVQPTSGRKDKLTLCVRLEDPECEWSWVGVTADPGCMKA